MYNFFFFYRVQSFTQVKNYMTLLAPISSFSFGFQSTQISISATSQIAEKNERTILSRELTHSTNMSSSYYWFTVFCHEKSSKSACDRGIGIASLREHRYHWSSNK